MVERRKGDKKHPELVICDDLYGEGRLCVHERKDPVVKGHVIPLVRAVTEYLCNHKSFGPLWDNMRHHAFRSGDELTLLIRCMERPLQKGAPTMYL
ncbi:hypothetical protein CC1G_14076 [Coprinopsis cinerea okayama7|uniref:Uncharacterized protein n=1 Tax=Coprinopsis cinerea (strain Okayama-7 / 130 / ATCC MYA-4618 / FGSC 9003) TaxID=240176 RepID=D6RL49_COPC7|nr:hypothetical protein CC1G_14076 [Coprinopsis cinerea okayama7\|eukprot:XP_002911544.1 hypothetical protein CC1G_14076 [Coprinopsis cinerea okayama7\